MWHVGLVVVDSHCWWLSVMSLKDGASNRNVGFQYTIDHCEAIVRLVLSSLIFFVSVRLVFAEHLVSFSFFKFSNDIGEKVVNHTIRMILMTINWKSYLNLIASMCLFVCACMNAYVRVYAGMTAYREVSVKRSYVSFFNTIHAVTT